VWPYLAMANDQGQRRRSVVGGRPVADRAGGESIDEGSSSSARPAWSAKGVLRESLLAPDVEEVVAGHPDGRLESGHAKLREVTLADFGDLAPDHGRTLAGADGLLLLALGVSSVGLDEAEYSVISYDYPMAAGGARLPRVNPQATFIYVSGAGTDPRTGPPGCGARVKGRHRAGHHRACCPTGYAFRPRDHSAHARREVRRPGSTTRSTRSRGPLISLVDRVAPELLSTST